MTIYSINRTTSYFILDEKGFEEYERHNTKTLNYAFRSIDTAREAIILRLEEEWKKLEDRGMELRCGTSLQSAKIEIRTSLQCRLVLHNPNGEIGNLYEVEWKIKRLQLED